MGENVDDLRRVLGDRVSNVYVSARSGDYQLLLGAGATLGAKNARGLEIPMTAGLIDLMRNEFPEALIEEGNTLQRAYQRAVQQVGTEGVWFFLKKIFGSADHQQWFTRLAELPWGRVWTLNVDDAFERAFPKGARSRIMSYRSVSWDEEYSEPDALQVVHLHGSVIGSTPTPLIFSFSEYAGLAEKRPVWDNMLRGSVSAQPFVIIGARGLDDPDIEATLLGNKPQHRAPSIIVNPHVTAGQRKEFEALGYMVFEGTAENFIEQWAELTDMSADQLLSIYRTTSVSIPEFTELSLEKAEIPAGNHDFFGGSEPLWNDARSGSIAQFEWMGAVTQSAREWAGDRSRKTELHVIFSERLTGLSSGLLGIAAELRNLGITVLSFDRRARFNRRRLLDYCRDRGPVLILCDAAHEFTMYFDDFLNEAAADANCKVLVLFGEKSFNELQVDNHFRGSRVARETTVLPRRRSRRDSTFIESLLSRRGRLGRLEQSPISVRRAHFYGRDIFSAMAEVEQGRGFKKRLSKEISSLNQDWHRDLLLMLAIAAYGGHQVGIQEAAFGVRVSVDKLLEAVRSNPSLNAVIEVAGDLVFARQRSASLDGLFAGEQAQSRLSSLAHVTRALSGLATSSSLRERNRAASLVGGLMQARTLREVFPGANIDGYYDSLFPEFGAWNARYWEQRAINARWEGNWAPAESWASRAVTIKDDPYTRTTLGTILLNKALVNLEYGETIWVDLYRRGKSELDEALHQDPGNRVAAVSFLRASLNLMRACIRHVPNGRSSQEFAAIAADWRASYANVQLVGTVDDSARRQAYEMVQEYESYTSDPSERSESSRRPGGAIDAARSHQSRDRGRGARPAGNPKAASNRSREDESAEPTARDSRSPGAKRRRRRSRGDRRQSGQGDAN